jgi:hypothetical protein
VNLVDPIQYLVGIELLLRFEFIVQNNFHQFEVLRRQFPIELPRNVHAMWHQLAGRGRDHLRFSRLTLNVFELEDPRGASSMCL